MSIHKENTFEQEICEHLGSHSWLYDPGKAEGYDRELALFPADAIEPGCTNSFRSKRINFVAHAEVFDLLLQVLGEGRHRKLRESLKF